MAVWFPKPENLAVPGAGFGISRATAHRHQDEAATALADQASDLHDALRRAEDEGLGHVVLDGKVFSADRLREKTTSVKRSLVTEQRSGVSFERFGEVGELSAADSARQPGDGAELREPTRIRVEDVGVNVVYSLRDSWASGGCSTAGSLRVAHVRHSRRHRSLREPLGQRRAR